MRAVFGLVLIIGVALAGFAVYMARGILNQNAVELARARAHITPTVMVYVASKKLKYGDVLTKQDVREIAWPKDAVPASGSDHILPSSSKISVQSLTRPSRASLAVPCPATT